MYTETGDTFYCCSVEVYKKPRRECGPFYLSEEEEPLLDFLRQVRSVFLGDQVRPDVMWRPRKLMFPHALLPPVYEERSMFCLSVPPA